MYVCHYFNDDVNLNFDVTVIILVELQSYAYWTLVTRLSKHNRLSSLKISSHQSTT